MENPVVNIVLIFVIVMFVGGVIAYFQYRDEPNSKKNRRPELPALELTGKVDRDERGLHIVLSWKRPDRPNWRQHCQLYRTPSFMVEIAQGKIEWLNIYEYEYKDYNVNVGSLYEYSVIEPDWSNNSGPSANPKGIKSNALRIVVK